MIEKLFAICDKKKNRKTQKIIYFHGTKIKSSVIWQFFQLTFYQFINLSPILSVRIIPRLVFPSEELKRIF